MSKFWDSFNQGLASGDRMVAMYQKAKLGRDIKDINSDNPTQSYSDENQAAINAAYSPEASGAPSNSTWVPNDGSVPQGVDNTKDSPYEAPADGGGYWQGQDGQKYTPAPSKGVSTKGTYDLGDGKSAGLDRWTLGDKTQADAFTRPEVQSYHMNKIGDLIEANGDHEKAMQYRSQGTQLEAAGLQINAAKREEDNEVGYAKSIKHAEEAEKAVSAVATPVIDKIQRGEMSLQEGIPQILHSYNTAFNNGHTASYDPKTGTIISIVGGRAQQVTGADGKPLVVTAAHLNDVLGSLGKQVNDFKDSEYVKYHPKDYMSARQLRQQAEQFAMTNDLAQQTHGLATKTFDMTKDHYTKADADAINRTSILSRETKIKEDMVDSEKAKNYGIGAHYASANNLSNYTLKQQQDFDVARNGVIGKIERNEISEVEGQKQLNRLAQKYGGKGAEPKAVTPKDLDDIRQSLMGVKGFKDMPVEKQTELFNQSVQDFQNQSFGTNNGVQTKNWVYKADGSVDKNDGAKPGLDRKLFTSDAVFEKANKEYKAKEADREARGLRLKAYAEEDQTPVLPWGH